MAERIADLYLDLSVRGADNLDQTLRRGRESLEQMGQQADETAEATRQAALRSTSAYERVAKEMQNTQRTAARYSQEVRDSAQREEMALGRLEDARRRYGDTSRQAVEAENRWQRAQRESERASQRAERQLDQLRIAQQRAAQAAQRAARDVQQANEGISQPIDAPEIQGAEGAGEDGGSGMGGGFMAGFAARIAGLGSKAGPIGMAIAGVAAIGLGAGAMLANAIVEGAERERVRDDMQAKLGIDEESAKKMAAAASNAYVAMWGESVADNMATLTALGDFQLLDTNMPQKDMEGLIAKVGTLNQLLGTETSDTLRGVSGLVRSGLVTDMNEAADLIVVARQQGLNAQGDLIDSLSEYSTGWKNSGLSAKTSLALIKQSMELGVDNTDRGADAIREFGRRVTEEGDTIVGTLNDIGLNGTDMYEAFKRGGPDAEKAFDTAFDTIRKIEDPTKRNAAAMALLGDTAGDFIGAFAQWDPSEATRKFGDIEGAADGAAKTLGENTATSWEGMQRTIEESVESVKASLAEAFGPEVANFANMIVENKDEIVAFFADVVSAAMTFGIGIGNTMAGALKVFGYTAGQMQSFLGVMVSMIGKGIGALGGLIEKIPGMQGVGGAMKSAGEFADKAGGEVAKMGDKAISLADTISNSLVPKLAETRDRFNLTADEATGAATKIDFLSGSVRAVPDGKSIIIQDNSPEARAKLEQLGFTVTTLPDGTVRVEAKTESAQTTIDQFIQNNGNRRVIIDAIVKPLIDPNYTPPAPRPAPVGPAQQFLVPKQPNADGSIREYADGGIDGHLPDQAVIQPARGKRGLVQWAESDAGPWEAFIPGAPNKRHRAINILGEVADRFGYSLLRSYADGGFYGAEPYGLPAGTSGPINVPWVDAIERAFGVTAATYAGHQEKDGLNKGIDWSGPVENMQKLAEYFASIANSMEQVIWMNPQTGQQIGIADGRPVGPGTDQPGYYSADWAGHQDHVHTRQSFALPLPGQAGGYGQQIQDITLTAKSSRDDVARKIIAEGRRRGYTDEEIAVVLAHARGESNLNPNAVGGGGAWHGVFQQDSGYPGRDDPNQNIAAFYDRLDAKRASPGASGDIWKDIFWLQQAPGVDNADMAYVTGRKEYMQEMKAHEGEARDLMMRLGPTVGGSGYGVEDGGGYDSGAGSGKGKEPPEDPNTVTLTFDNPFQPFWWKGEKEYRERIIDDYEKEQAWEDYINKRGDWAPKEQKQATSRKTLADATRDLKEAEDDLTLAKMRQAELDPKSKPSAKESARQAVGQAEQKVNDAKAALEEAKRMPNPVQKYAMGDVRNGHQPEIVRPGDYRLWGEPETGGESYIPHAPDRRARALGIWAQTGKILGVQGFAAGGFGGYAPDTRDAMAPKNLYDLMALGVGGTMMAANTIAPYLKMALTGQVDLGSLAPTVDLKSNNPPLVAEYVGKISEQISNQLTELIWAVKDGKNIRVVVENATGPSGLALTRRGK
ncbi:tape measure protein [Gordonia phage Gudmit]|nr:tape measure protein [Gordonia phage Gudmit]